MRRLVATVIFLLVSGPAFGDNAEFFSLNFSMSTEGNRAAVASSRPQPFPANSVVPANPGTQAQTARRQRPHMIELNAANWQPLKNSEKFGLFARDLTHWGTQASIAFDSGLSFATRDRPFLGNGARGYFTRYGLNVADEANFCFFSTFFFPSVFHQDPRYIPHDSGKTSKRLAYSVTRVLITRSDSGKAEVNLSNLLGVLFATSISSAMYSSYGADVGVGGNFVAFGYNMGSEAAFNILKEFWPDVARKMKVRMWLRNVVRASLRDYVRVS